MSAKAYFWAREYGRHARLKSGPYSVLKELADCHNQDTGQCNPSVAHIAEYTGLNRKTVMTALNELETRGAVTPFKKNGFRTDYNINFYLFDASTSTKNGTGKKDSTGKASSTSIEAGPENGTGPENGIGAVPETGQPPVPKTGHEPITKPKKNLKEILLDRFEEFWKAYPKKKSKGAAEKVWLKLKPSQELTNEIIAAIQNQKTSEDWTKQNGQFIPHPATWLNAKGWCDETQVEQKTQAPSAQRAPTWQEKGFSSQEVFDQYISKRQYLSDLQGTGKPNEHILNEIERTKAALQRLRPQPQGAEV